MRLVYSESPRNTFMAAVEYYWGYTDDESFVSYATYCFNQIYKYPRGLGVRYWEDYDEIHLHKFT